MIAVDNHALTKRNFRLKKHGKLFDLIAWYRNNSFVTQLLNAYTLLIPDGEQFIIRTCKPYVGQTHFELKEELKRLFYQEGAHAREHDKILGAMRAQGVGLDAFGGFIKTLSYRFLEPLFPRTLCLATAAGIEHHNSVIANFFLQKDLLRGVSIDELRRLFLWHFAEEIEHKEVVFKLLQSVSPAWPVRAAGLALSFATFLFFLILGTLLVGLKTGAALTLAFWCEAGVQCFGTGGLLPELLKESFRYLRPGFRPRVSDNQPLLDSALTELDHLGVDQPTPKSNERVLPAAFQEVMGPFFERVDALESRHPFFSAR